jgi:hypothetical protein
MAVKAKPAIFSLALIALVVVVIVVGLPTLGRRQAVPGPGAPAAPRPAIGDKHPPELSPPTLRPPDSADSCPVSVVGSSDRTVGGSGTVTFTVDLSVLSERGDEFDISYHVVEKGSPAKVDTERVLKQYVEHYSSPQGEGSFKFQVDTHPVDVEHTVTITVGSHNAACREVRTTLSVMP